MYGPVHDIENVLPETLDADDHEYAPAHSLVLPLPDPRNPKHYPHT